MTNHTREIADARFLARIETAGERRAAQVAAMPRDCLIRGVSEPGDWGPFTISLVQPEPRPHLLRRLVWPGVALCAVGLLALGVLG